MEGRQTRQAIEAARHLRNFQALNPQEQERLAASRVLIAGLGGLGGYVAEYLGRLGVGYLRLVDGDVYSASNLNRQLFADEQTLGQPKVQVACRRLQEIDPGLVVEPLVCYAAAADWPRLLVGQDVVVDALDNIPDRLALAAAAQTAAVPLVHGAIAGWQGHLCTALPGDDCLTRLYEGVESAHGAEEELGNLSFVAGLLAAWQAAEAVKLLLGRGVCSAGCLIELDLLQNRVQRIGL